MSQSEKAELHKVLPAAWLAGYFQQQSFINSPALLFQTTGSLTPFKN